MWATALWPWVTLAVVAIVVYMVTYTLLRTSGDGRPWHVRLRHPTSQAPEEKRPSGK